MFTGIIEAAARVLEITNSQIQIERPENFENIKLGQSIAVNGACLSVVEFSESFLRFDVVPETFSRTNLQTSKKVNLERAMKANGRFEGHVVTGHVDGIVKLISRKKEGNGEEWQFELPEKFQKYMVEKGSVTLNGVSLTVATVSEKSFSVALIPHTLQETNLKNFCKNNIINIEFDILAKYAQKWSKVKN